MRSLACIALMIVSTACHLASGLDDLRIETRVADGGAPPTTQCEKWEDTFDIIDTEERWSILRVGGNPPPIEVDEVDPNENSLVIAIDDATTTASYTGLITKDKYDLTDCTVAIAIKPPTAVGLSAVIGVTTRDDLTEEPILSLRKENSTLFGRYIPAMGSEDSPSEASDDYTQTKYFWRIAESSGQVFFETSENGDSWQRIGTSGVKTPFEATQIHVFFAAGVDATASVATGQIDHFFMDRHE